MIPRPPRDVSGLKLAALLGGLWERGCRPVSAPATSSRATRFRYQLAGTVDEPQCGHLKIGLVLSETILHL